MTARKTAVRKTKSTVAHHPSVSKPREYASAWSMVGHIKPRVLKRIKRYSIEPRNNADSHYVWEGENLVSMVSLKARLGGKVDLILTDPPYNTGKDFRYNDCWNTSPDDPAWGKLVPPTDPDRHGKWECFMMLRLQMMKNLLTEQGVLAICIDHRELFRLGIILDEVFGEENRIGIINWQKSYAPRNDNKHISTATEYVLVYARNEKKAKTIREPRTRSMNANFKNPDDDPNGEWRGNDPAAGSGNRQAQYGIQSPFTGKMHYPGNNYWRYRKANMLEWLNAWGTEYEERAIGDRPPRADKASGKIGEANAKEIKDLVIKGYRFNEKKPAEERKNKALLEKARKKAQCIKPWPFLYFLSDGEGRPRTKRYLKDVQQGKVPLDYWSEGDYSKPFHLGTQSWPHKESGHSQDGLRDLEITIGKNHGFQTAKPLKLFKKIIQLWCPPNGCVLDPFAGSGTTGAAVLELNAETSASRRFHLIEQGNPGKKDKYARKLIVPRLKNILAATKQDAGIEFFQLLEGKIDAQRLMQMERIELIDQIMNLHTNGKGKNLLRRIEDGKSLHLFAYDPGKNEGYFLIWGQRSGKRASVLNRVAWKELLAEARKNCLDGEHYTVYASSFALFTNNMKRMKIPDSILAGLGLETYER